MYDPPFELYVGRFAFHYSHEQPNELLALFTEKDRRPRSDELGIDADAGETSSPSLASDPKGPTSDDEDTDESYSQKAYDVAVPVMRERLEIMGFSDAVWREELQEYVDRKIAYRVKFVERSEPGTPERTLAERTLAIVQGSSLQRWMKKWLQLVDHAVNQNYTVPEDTLMHEMSDKHVQLEPIFTRELIALRGALEVLEDDDFVTFDFTNAVYQEEIVTAHEPLAEMARYAVLRAVREFDPILVLTEGRTDARIISESFDRIHPEIAHMFSYMDHETFKVPGGDACSRRIGAKSGGGKDIQSNYLSLRQRHGRARGVLPIPESELS